MPEEEITTSSQNAGGADGAESKSKKKKNKKRKKQPPQPGDPDYKTPTQLRNARKRRKKKQDKANSNSNGPSSSTAGKETTGATSLPYGSINDPSLKYLSNPKAAPTVRNAIKFFREKTNAEAGTNHDEYFPVICGPKLGWRTVARLAVKNNRQEKQNQLRIGLFVPGSHELLPVPDCPVHHRKINGLVKVLEETCNSLGVQAMDDDGDGDNNNDSFGLRYIAIAVERTTKKQQLVLVWKEASENNDDNNNAIIDKLIQELVKLSRDKTKQDIRLQSVWVHYNNTWKHSNSIFDRQGRWETKVVDGKKNNNENDDNNDDKNDNDPLYGSIRECMLPLAPKKNKDGKIIPKTTSPLEKIHVPLFFPPQVFRQANLDGFAKIILRIREWLHEQQLKEPAMSESLDTQEGDEKGRQEQQQEQQPKRKRRRGKRDTSNNKEEKANDSKTFPSTTTNAGNLKSLGHCLELYGGVGTIGLNLVDFFDSLDSSDENPFNEICFHASADQMKVVTNDQKSLLDPSKRSKITYTSKSASDICVEQYESLKKARVVVVDPPRKGLDAPVVEALCSDYGESSELVQHLVYVSCGFDAFRRDYRALVEHSGKWTLDKAEGHILFPGSDAIETLAFFTRTKE